ncbi:MAG: glycosyltransferase family 4 protein [Anaerolineae bacterium]
MKVLFVMSSFPRWEGDIHTPWAVELIHRLQARGANVTVLAPAYQGLRDHTAAGIPVKRFRYAPSAWEALTHESGAPNKIRRNPLYLTLLPAYLLAGAVRLRRLCRDLGPDVIHVHWPIPHALLAFWGCPRQRPRLVSTFYGADAALVRRYPALRPLLRRVVRESDACTAISRYTAEMVHQLAGVRPAVIPYGMDLSARASLPAVQKPAAFEILTVGRLIERKGHAVLLRAFAQLLRRRNDVALTIIGEGQERPRLEALIRELGLEGAAVLRGRVSDEELQRAYARCDIFVLPAILDAGGDTEGLGMVLLEAMRYEKPVVASAVGGITDIVEHGVSGLLVPPADAEALAGALTYLLENPGRARELAGTARRLNAERFDWERIVDAYWRLYMGQTR